MLILEIVQVLNGVSLYAIPSGIPAFVMIFGLIGYIAPDHSSTCEMAVKCEPPMLVHFVFRGFLHVMQLSF